MIFQNPESFLFLLLVPLLFVFRKTGLFTRISFDLTLSDWNGKSFRWRKRSFSLLSALTGFLRFAAFLALVLALSDPVLRHEEKIYTSRGTQILFLLDTSPSMASRDMSFMGETLNRMEAAKRGIRTLVEGDNGFSFALVAMASEAASVVPPTTDKRLFLERLDSLQIGSLGDGTAIGTGLCSAVYHLSSTPAPKKCIVLITDGESNAGSVHAETAARLAADSSIPVYALGIGTRGTVQVEYVDPFSGKVRSGFYESAFDPAPLEKIAAVSGGRYFGIESLGALSDTLASICVREGVSQEFRTRHVDEPLYGKFLEVSLALFFVSWIFRRILLSEVL